MKRDWKPGDVAIVDGPGTRLPITFYENENTTELMFNNGSGFQHPARHLALTARPLVVLDPENREQVARVAEALEASYRADDRDAEPDYDFRVTQAALRSLLEPPKPEEPTGLGAVVEDSRGNRWIRSGDDRLAAPWFRRNTPGAPQYESWASVNAVRVLSEGVRDV